MASACGVTAPGGCVDDRRCGWRWLAKDVPRHPREGGGEGRAAPGVQDRRQRAANRASGLRQDDAGARYSVAVRRHDRGGEAGRGMRGVGSESPGRAMVGSRGRPGEVTLATHGVLLLDDFANFRRDVIDEVRRAIARGHVEHDGDDHVLARLPARPAIVIGAACECPCGLERCTCTAHARAAHQSRLESWPWQAVVRVVRVGR